MPEPVLILLVGGSTSQYTTLHMTNRANTNAYKSKAMTGNPLPAHHLDSDREVQTVKYLSQLGSSYRLPPVPLSPADPGVPTMAFGSLKKVVVDALNCVQRASQLPPRKSAVKNWNTEMTRLYVRDSRIRTRCSEAIT